MKKYFCGNCNGAVDKDTEVCPHCHSTFWSFKNPSWTELIFKREEDCPDEAEQS